MPLGWNRKTLGIPQWLSSKESAYNAGATWVPSLGQEDPLEEGMATHYSILAWRIPRTEEAGGLQSVRSQRVGHDWSYWAHRHAHIGRLYGVSMESLDITKDKGFSTEKKSSFQLLLNHRRKTIFSMSAPFIKYTTKTLIPKGEGPDGLIDRLVCQPNVCHYVSQVLCISGSFFSFTLQIARCPFPWHIPLKKKKSQGCIISLRILR